MSNSSSSKELREGHLNMEHLPIRIQSKIISNIEGGVSDIKLNDSITSGTANPHCKPNNPSDISTDDKIRVIKKLSVNTPIKMPLWFSKMEKILENLSTSKENFKKIIEKLQSIISAESYLENWIIFHELRVTLSPIVTKIFEKELRFCCENNLDSYFWKILFYSVLQYLKCQSKNCEKCEDDDFRLKSIQIIQDGLIFYNNLILQFEKNYSFRTENLIDNKIVHKEKVSSLVKVTIQKFLLNLGDLNRYQAQIENKSYLEARKYYLKAQALIPGNGVPYNQLAIIALTFNNYFEAVYYYVRALSSSNPIISAKESLKILLDEIRKKYDEKFKPKQTLINASTKVTNEQCSIKNFRKEIWIHSNGSRKLRFQTESIDEDNTTKKNFNNSDLITKKGSEENFVKFNHENFDDISAKNLRKEFISSYLFVVSKIFIGVDLENFENAMLQMLFDFSNVVNRCPNILNRTQHLEITAINVFLYDYNKHKDFHNENVATKKYIGNYSFTVGLLMFGIIINRANDLLNEYTIQLNEKKIANCKQDIENIIQLVQNLPPEFIELLQPIRIFCSWLNVNLDLCKPSISNYYQQITPWQNFANLLTSISKLFGDILIDSNFQTSISESSSGNVQLEENIFLLGFTPLKTILEKPYKNIKNFDEEVLAVLYRLNDIIKFAYDNLCSKEIAILKVEKNYNSNLVFTKNIKLFEKHLHADSSSDSIEKEILNESDDYENSKQTWSEIVSESILQNEIEQQNDITESKHYSLLYKKMMLEKSSKAQEIYKERLQNILEDVGNQTIIEVKPKYLFPDTNCFIDFLNEIEYLIKTYDTYILMVPLVVLNELEGLTKGFKIGLARGDSEMLSWKMANSRIHHFDEVARISEQAINFIKNKNNLNIRYCTTRGSILKKSSTFTFEQNNDDELTSNDDKILTSALSILSENTIEKYPNKSVIRTEVVLLTTDRNLRVKALAKNLAVCGLKEFLVWAEGKEGFN